MSATLIHTLHKLTLDDPVVSNPCYPQGLKRKREESDDEYEELPTRDQAPSGGLRRRGPGDRTTKFKPAMSKKLTSISNRRPTPASYRPDLLAFLSIEALGQICSYLQSKDILALSATCRRLSMWRLAASTNICFKVDGVRVAPAVLVMKKLLNILYTYPFLADFVLSIRVEVRWRQCTDPMALLRYGQKFVEPLDKVLSRIVDVSPNIRSFVLNANHSVQGWIVPRTINSLLSRRELRDLYLSCIDVPSQWYPTLTHSLASSLERIIIHSPGADIAWCGAFMYDLPNLKLLDLCETTSTGTSGQWLDNDDWAARRWTSVEAIRVSGDAAIIAHYIGAIYRGVREGTWLKFDSLTITTMLSDELYPDLIRALSILRLRYFCLVVNIGGRYPSGFGPHVVHTMLSCLPLLENLELREFETRQYSPLPGSLEEWSAVISTAGRLRRLVLPTLLIVNPDVSRSLLNLELPRSDSDKEADSRLVDGSQRLSATSEAHLDMPPSMKHTCFDLSIFVKHFVSHLRSPTFQELYFSHVDFDAGCKYTIKFLQVHCMDTDSRGLPGYMIARDSPEEWEAWEWEFKIPRSYYQREEIDAYRPVTNSERHCR